MRLGEDQLLGITRSVDDYGVDYDDDVDDDDELMIMIR